MATDTLYVVVARDCEAEDRAASEWHDDGLGENEPRAYAECAEFVAWACSDKCDWRREGPHEYAIAEVDEQGHVIPGATHRSGERRDDEPAPTDAKSPREHGFEDGEAMAQELSERRWRLDPDYIEEDVRAEVEKIVGGDPSGVLVNAMGSSKAEELFGLPENAAETAPAAWAKALAEYNAGFREGVLSTLKDADDEPKTAECAYCHLDVAEGPVPAADDDEAWAELAQRHEVACEWIATRAHQRDGVAKSIRTAMGECEAAARREGYAIVGAGQSYAPNSQDFDYVAEQIRSAYGRMPTKAEWAEAGWHVEGAHCEG